MSLTVSTIKNDVAPIQPDINPGGEKAVKWLEPD